MHAKVPLTLLYGKEREKKKRKKQKKRKSISRTSEAQKGNLVLSYQSDPERFFLTLAWLCCFFSNTKKKAHFKNLPFKDTLKVENNKTHLSFHRLSSFLSSFPLYFSIYFAFFVVSYSVEDTSRVRKTEDNP